MGHPPPIAIPSQSSPSGLDSLRSFPGCGSVVAVLHRPYCHGYEVAGGRLGVLAIGEINVHQALLLPEWSSDVTLFTNGTFEPTDEQRVARSLAEQLRCAFDDGPSGPMIRTDATKATTTPGVCAAGDVARAQHNATWASADGVMAGIAAHRSLALDS